jgi:hypothetical protein
MGCGAGPVTAPLLDQIIAAVERPPAVEGFPAIGGDRGVQTGATARQIAIELSLLRRVILRRLGERSSVSAAEYELLWVAFESALADAFAPNRELGAESNEALADTSGADEQRTASERRDRFLGEASRILAESLDHQETLRSIARLAVPEIADLCIIDLVREGGTLVRVATEHRDAARAGLASQLHRGSNRGSKATGRVNVGTSTRRILTVAGNPRNARRCRHAFRMAESPSLHSCSSSIRSMPVRN